MNLSKIKDLEEFKSLNEENKTKILDLLRSGIFMKNMMDSSKQHPRLEVNIKDNTGELNSVDLFVVDILNDDFYPLVKFSKGKHTIKRKSKKNPEGIFILEEDIKNSQEYKDRKKLVQDSIKVSQEYEFSKLSSLISTLLKEQEG